MRKCISIGFCFFILLIHAFPGMAEIASGKLIMKNGKPHSGNAEFKFAIIRQNITIWSNDGSSIDGKEPTGWITLPVSNGYYTFELGEKPMRPFFYELLKTYREPVLRTWVNTGDGFYALSDQMIDTDSLIELLDKNYQRDYLEQQNKNRNPPPLLNTPRTMGRTEEKVNKKPTNGMGWLDDWLLQHAGPDGTVPAGALIQAKYHIDNMPQYDDAGIWHWEWLGPGNIGGRIRAMSIHPNNPDWIIIGSVSGGIWRSVDGGSTWTAVDDFLASLAISSIVYDPVHPDIMYAGTSEFDFPGAGIFKSYNNGQSWSQLPSTNNSNFTYVSRLAHHPDSTRILYATTESPCSIWKSKDGGTTWNLLKTLTSSVFDIKVSPHTPYNRIIVGTRAPGQVWISSDWGATWTEQTTGGTNKLPDDGGRCEVSFSQSNYNCIYVSMDKNDGQLWRTTNNATSWTLVNNTSYLHAQGWYNNTIWVDPFDHNHLVVGGVDLWRSTDGGYTLTKISNWMNYHNNSAMNSAHADQHIILSPPDYNGTTNRKVYFGNDGGIQMTNNIQTVTQSSGWVNLCNSSLGITQFYAGSAMPDGSIILGGTQDNDNLRYRSSGNWSGTAGWFQSKTGDGGATAIDYLHPDTMYTEYINLSMHRSTDGGDTYSSAISGLTDAGSDALFISPFSMDPNALSRLIAGGRKIWRTNNSANSWHSIRDSIGGKCSAIDIAQGNSDLIWVGYSDGHVAKTTNGTATTPTWIRLDNNTTALPDRYVTDICISPDNHNEVFVTFSGYYYDNVWFSSDGGNTWSNRSGTAPNNLPALQVNTVRVHPASNNWVYIGTDLGIFSSEDLGVNWNTTPRYASNDGPCNVLVKELFWQGDDYLIAVTFGRGMYRSHPFTIIYVDANAPPGGNGTAAAPFQTVTAAVNAAGHGTAISIKTNNYNEPNPLLLYKRGLIKATNGSAVIK